MRPFCLWRGIMEPSLRMIFKKRPRIAPHSRVGPLHFRITHPYHPLSGQDFEVVSHRKYFTEDRVYFFDESGGYRSIPAQFTSLAPQDPFVVMSAGRSHFRTEDLLELAKVLEKLRA